MRFDWQYHQIAKRGAVALLLALMFYIMGSIVYGAIFNDFVPLLYGSYAIMISAVTAAVLFLAYMLFVVIKAAIYYVITGRDLY